MNKCVLIVLLLMAIVCACSIGNYGGEESEFRFDYELFEDNKSKSAIFQNRKYSFKYSVVGSTGTLVSADVKVGDISQFEISILDNYDYNNYPSEHLEDEIKYLEEQGFIIKNIEDVFSCVSKLEEECVLIVSQNNDLRSIFLNVQYNEQGIPIYINIERNWKVNYSPLGVFGPKILITDFFYEL